MQSMARKKKSSRDSAGFRRRRGQVRSLRQQLLIVCEGERTEPTYFNSFNAPKNVVTVVGVGGDPLQLIAEAIQRQMEATRSGLPYDQVWCVFDRDSWTRQRFMQAIDAAAGANFRVAYSNEAFELWYLLHFDFHNTAISRDTYKERLTRKLGFEYRKNHPDMYSILKNRQALAIKYAENLLAQYEPCDPANDNPSTTVHLLVQELNKHARP